MHSSRIILSFLLCQSKARNYCADVKFCVLSTGGAAAASIGRENDLKNGQAVSGQNEAPNDDENGKLQEQRAS